MGLAFGCSTAVVVINAIALAFLILATITAPVVSQLGLAEADDYRYGVFGVCSTSGSTCSDASFPYKLSTLGSDSNWKMDDDARDTLAKILIVAPIAAGLTLISLIFNFFAHFQTFGSSLAFYLIGFFFTLVAFLAAAVICIVTFLAFFPHVTWVAWLLIPAAILNLLAVPLVFFALRTTPNKFNDEEDEEVDDKNLTDLSDGDHFKSNNEFKLDDFTGPPNTFTNHNNLSSDKNSPSSNLRVITNDSSSLNDQRSGLEKATIHDYSTNTNPTQNFNYNGKIQTQPYGSEGTANLVSSQNYNRGGAVRSEAPSFQPQAAKPDYSTAAATSVYPKSTYQSANYAGSAQQPRSSGPTQQGRPAQRIQQPGYPRNPDSTGSYPNSNNQPTSAGGMTSGVPTASSVYNDDTQNVLGNSRHGSSANSDEYELTNDNDSDFTSVSQRAVNPNYYRGANQAPTLFPNQDQQQMASINHGGATAPPPPATQNDYYQSNAPLAQPHHQPYTPQQQSFPDRASSYYSANGTTAPAPYSPQQYQNTSFQQGPPIQGPSQPPKQPRKNTSDVLLSTNPDFMISGPASQRQQFNKRPNPQGVAGYRPAYKRNQAGASKLPAASLSADSPYNFR